MRRLLTALALVTAALVIPSGPAAGQSGVSASTDRGTARSGEEIVVRGTGWPADSRVQASICGNQARALSADCDLPSSRTIVTDSEGSFAVPLDVEVPPSPCPCVVFVSGQNTASTVRFPIEVLDAPSAPTTTPEITPARDFAVLRSALTGSGPWTAWFGAAPTRTLELTVENTGTIAAAPNLSATWGTGASPTHVLDTPDLEPIEPGETVRYRIPVRFDALGFGSINVAGSVSGSSGPISFTTSTSTYPWALLALALIAVQVLLLSIRNRVRARIHRRGPGDPIGPVAPAELEPGAVAALPAGDDADDPPIDLADRGSVTGSSADPAEPIGLADPYEADTARAVAASSALAARLRRETDVALLDHHEQATALAADLRRDAAEQSALLRSSAQDAQEQLSSSIASTREQAAGAAAAAADEAAALVEEAIAHRDAARAVLDEATAHAHVVIGAAEKQAIRFEESAAQWQAERDAIAARHQEQIDELERVDARLLDIRGRIEGRAMAISEDADLRSQLLVERAAETEAELRDEAHRSLVDIVTRSAQVSAATVFATATAPVAHDTERTNSTPSGPAHLAETHRRRRLWRRTRAVSTRDGGT